MAPYQLNRKVERLAQAPRRIAGGERHNAKISIERRHCQALPTADFERRLALRVNARFQMSIAILVPSLLSEADLPPSSAVAQELSLGLAVLLVAVYALGMLFSHGTHRELFANVSHADEGARPWPLAVGIVILVVVTLLVALVSEIFVGSVQVAAESLGMTPAFVGFIVVALAGAVAEMTSAFSVARANRLDLSVSIALGSAAQIALFVAPVLVLVSYFTGPEPMTLKFRRGAVTMMLVATLAIFLSNGGPGAWHVGVMLLAVYAIFPVTLFPLPPSARLRPRWRLVYGNSDEN